MDARTEAPPQLGYWNAEAWLRLRYGLGDTNAVEPESAIGWARIAVE